MSLFKIKTPFAPAGDQPAAIEKLVSLRPGSSTLFGVTGSGKTCTIAHVIQAQEKPVLILAPNKTLAAQLYEEFSLFFPDNKVCYFVSYYDYYQPESYIPSQDVYIAKETKINPELERLRIEASASLINRSDTIVIASVSAIYSLGNPFDYKELALSIRTSQVMDRESLINALLKIQYKRNDIERSVGTFQVIGNTVEVILPYQKEKVRIEIHKGLIEGIFWVDRMQNSVLMNLDNAIIFPAKHFVMRDELKEKGLRTIEAELHGWLPKLEKDMYRERLYQRVMHDIEMIKETGFCSGIENYSSHFDGRPEDRPPYCLFDFFPKDFLVIVDESHITLPQLRGMYAGDRSRKSALIEYGFRLPSAYNNRPLRFEEIEQYFNDVIFVSATPGPYELSHSSTVVEQIIRPTGLVDPIVTIHSRENQMDDLCRNIQETTAKGFRTLVMVMTKQLAEDMADYLEDQKIAVCYLHSELKTPQRSELIQKLRLGEFDCLVGVNLLREGLDIPEVAFVAIMDADLESFLRDKRSLIQIIGRAARNNEAHVILYADRITDSMKLAMEETARRRLLQEQYNKKHKIVAQTVSRSVVKSIIDIQKTIAKASKRKSMSKKTALNQLDAYSIVELEKQMEAAAERFDFETAIEIRDYLLQKSND
jgi:excinuclease ABC subunit B